MKKRIMRDAAWWFFRRAGFGPLLLRIHPKSGLLKLGWFESFRLKKPVSRNKEPIPWWTYSAVAFLQERLSQDMRVLEFGCGYSTIWMATIVGEVVSVEDDAIWAKEVNKKLPNSTARVVLASSLEDFAATPSFDIGLFDVIVIDAGHRINIATQILPHIKQQACVIWDNTDGPDWPEIRDLLNTYGFREISFLGLVAQEVMLSRTTVFYRDGNCLGI